MTMTAARPDTTSDYFRLDDELTADEIRVRDAVRAFAEQRVLPVINEYWEKAEFPYERFLAWPSSALSAPPSGATDARA